VWTRLFVLFPHARTHILPLPFFFFFFFCCCTQGMCEVVCSVLCEVCMPIYSSLIPHKPTHTLTRSLTHTHTHTQAALAIRLHTRDRCKSFLHQSSGCGGVSGDYKPLACAECPGVWRAHRAEWYGEMCVCVCVCVCMCCVR
jgi:hypothetical protein